MLIAALAMPGLAPSVAAAQDGQVRILFVPSGTVPSRLRRVLENLLASRGEMLPTRAFTTAAARQGVRPTSRQGYRLAGEQGADVVVVASYGGHYRRRVLRVRFFSAQSGESVTGSSHTLVGQVLRAASQHRILRDLNEATGGRTAMPGAEEEADDREPPPSNAGDSGDEAGGDEGGGDEDGGLPPPLDWEAEEAAAAEGGGEEAAAEEEGGGDPETPQEELPIEEQRQWGFAVSGGGGIMNRGTRVPTMLGAARLATLPFPGIQAEVIGSVRPDVASRFRLELAARYTTSIGLVAEDTRADGSTRSTDLRAHHFRFGIGGHIPLSPGERPTMLFLELGYQLRMLDSEIMVSIPDYTLAGIVFRVGLFFTIGDSPISIGIIPEIGHAQNLSDDLGNTAQVSDGVLVGGELAVRVLIIPEVSLILMYRESHAIMSTELDGQDSLADEERYGMLRAEYRF